MHDITDEPHHTNTTQNTDVAIDPTWRLRWWHEVTLWHDGQWGGLDKRKQPDVVSYWTTHTGSDVMAPGYGWR
jgi:hypothetical protein